MYAASEASDADDLAEVMASIDELLAVIGLGREAIDLEGLTRKTGIPARRVLQLLDGARPVSPPGTEGEQEVFVERLRFLRDTRLAPGGKKYTQDEIAAGTGISHGQVGYMLKGERTPKLLVAAKLERFFNVTPGFFTASEYQLLLRALAPIRDELTYVAFLRGKGITQIAMRSSTAADESSTIAKELRSALAAALTQQPGRDEEADADVRELAEQLSSLPTRSRRRVMRVLRDVLGLVPTADDDHEGSAGRAQTSR
ncbi:helix-turn-helix domain-containing protein [Streptomyces microflavus]|uniref:helix-turn-helix domain-containing protein n=1 Tax=Streptomyces microflavus TaxID=1919 RepID=UPI003818BBFB